MSAKTWCYTLNNPTNQEIEQFKAFECNKHRCAFEKGDSGTLHLQGVITFSKTYRLKALKKLCDKAHWEICKDSYKAFNYCTKGDIIINTCNTQQGHRSDLDEAINTAVNGSMYEFAVQHPNTYVRYHKGIESLVNRLNSKKNDFIKTRVIILYGKAGSGKSKLAREIDPNIYNVPEPINGSVWLDMYDREKTILLDDFYGWLKYHTLLQYLDGYRFQAPVKGGFVTRNWDTVIITSNQPWEMWYRERLEGFEALDRRITHIYNADTGQWERGEPILKNVTVTEVTEGNTKPPSQIIESPRCLI